MNLREISVARLKKNKIINIAKKYNNDIDYTYIT